MSPARPTLRRIAVIAGRALAFSWRQPLLWLLIGASIFAALAINPAAMIPSGDAAVAGQAPFANSRSALAQLFSLTGVIFLGFLIALLAGQAVLRDDEVRIGELLHSSGLRPFEYLFGHLTALLLLAGVLVAVQMTTVALLTEFGAGLGSDRARGPFALAHYLEPAAFFLLPGIFSCAFLGFAVAWATRSQLATTLGAAMLFLVGLLGLVPRPDSRFEDALALFFRLVDPWGARWLRQNLFERDLGTAFYNTAPLPLDGDFFLSRTVAVCMPILALVLAWRVARRRGAGSAAAVPKGRPKAAQERARTPRPSSSLPAITSPPGLLCAAGHLAALELRLTLRRPAFWAFSAFTAFFLLDYVQNLTGYFEAALVHTPTSLAVETIGPLTALLSLLLLFTGLDARDRPRRLRLQPLLDALPLTRPSLLLGELGAQAGIAGSLAAVAALACLAPLMAQGEPLALLPFIAIWGLLLLPTWLFWIAGIGAAWHLGGRAAALLAGLGLLAGTLALALQGRLGWVFNWPLWGALRFTEVGLFELVTRELTLNRLLMTASALALLGLTLGGMSTTERDGLRPAARRLGRAALLALPALVLGLALAAGIAAGPQGRAALFAEREMRRLNVEIYGRSAMADLEHVEAAIEIQPDERTFRVAGRYRLLNDGEAPLSHLFFTVGRDLGKVAWTVGGREVTAEDRSGLQVLPLAQPLGPGERLEIGFRYGAAPRGFNRNGGSFTSFVAPSGLLLDTLGPDFLPLPGYHPRDAAPDEPLPPPLSSEAWREVLPPLQGQRRGFTSRLSVTTPGDFIANGVGVRIADTVTGAMRTAVFESQAPVRFLNLAGGRLVEKRGPGVALFHLAEHGRHAEAILATLAASRRLYAELFGPLPWPEIRLTELPDHVTRAQSFPGNISFSEQAGFRAARADIATIVTAHEVAHQWWGHRLMPGRGPGADVLIEGLANYSTLLFLEKEHGPDARKDFARQLEERFLETRRIDVESPLLSVEDRGRATDGTVIYDKGAWAFWMLEREVGRSRLLASLRGLIAQSEAGHDFPLLPDLLALLRRDAPASERFETFVEDFLAGTALPEIVLSAPRVERRGGFVRLRVKVENVGGARVTLELAVRPRAGEDVRTTLSMGPAEARELVLDLPFEPVGLVADPDLHVLMIGRERAVLEL